MLDSQGEITKHLAIGDGSEGIDPGLIPDYIGNVQELFRTPADELKIESIHELLLPAFNRSRLVLNPIVGHLGIISYTDVCNQIFDDERPLGWGRFRRYADAGIQPTKQHYNNVIMLPKEAQYPDEILQIVAATGMMSHEHFDKALDTVSLEHPDLIELAKQAAYLNLASRTLLRFAIGTHALSDDKIQRMRLGSQGAIGTDDYKEPTRRITERVNEILTEKTGRSTNLPTRSLQFDEHHQNHTLLMDPAFEMTASAATLNVISRGLENSAAGINPVLAPAALEASQVVDGTEGALTYDEDVRYDESYDKIITDGVLRAANNTRHEAPDAHPGNVLGAHPYQAFSYIQFQEDIHRLISHTTQVANDDYVEHWNTAEKEAKPRLGKCPARFDLWDLDNGNPPEGSPAANAIASKNNAVARILEIHEAEVQVSQNPLLAELVSLPLVGAVICDGSPTARDAEGEFMKSFCAYWATRSSADMSLDASDTI